jgi:hypothetical protein
MLPADFWSLPYDQQQFVLATEDRVSRNLPPFTGITAEDDADPLQGAQTRRASSRSFTAGHSRSRMEK